MKKIINYEKDILFKTKIGEICSISLEQDFKYLNHKLTGNFIVTGEYKPNELSLNKEPFNYKLPMEYDIDENIDEDTLEYDIENFEYNINNDELNIYVDFGIRYEEKKVEPVIPTREEPTIEEPKEEIEDSNEDDEEYTIYHIHIVKEGDTLESISTKYNSTVELIKEYNKNTKLEVKDKLIIPEIYE